MDINKTLDKAIKVLMVCILCIMFTIGSLFIIPPKYAFALGNGDYTLSYSSSTLSATTQYSGITVCNFSNGRYGNTYIKGTENSSLPVYGFRSGTGFYIVLPSAYTNYHDSGYVFTVNGKLGDSSLDFSSTYYDDKFSYDSTNDLYYRLMGGVYSGYDTFYVDAVDLTTGFSAIREYIDNQSSGPSGPSSEYIEAYTDVKAGYVAYILVEEGTTIELTTQFPEYSRVKYPYWDSVARYNEGLSDLPTEGTTYTDTTGFSINWDKLSTDTNAWGQAKTGYVIFTDISAGYFVVYNPTYRNVTNDGRQLISPTIRVWTSDTYGVAQFPIKTRVSISDQGMTWLSTQTAGGYVATAEDYDATTDTWSYHYPNSTQSAIIPNGGGNALPENMSIQDYLQSIGETLSGLVHDVLTIFAAPISFIQDVISAGSAFMVAISQFFLWLPAPVYTLICTALMLIVVIGVFKYFHR